MSLIPQERSLLWFVMAIEELCQPLSKKELHCLLEVYGTKDFITIFHVPKL